MTSDGLGRGIVVMDRRAGVASLVFWRERAQPVSRAFWFLILAPHATLSSHLVLEREGPSMVDAAGASLLAAS